MPIYILIFLLASYTLLADDDIYSIPIDELMDINVIGVSNFEQKISDAPASVFIYTHADIEQNQYYDLSDLLKDVPGIDYTDYAGRFGEYYTVRGVEGNDRFLVLIDGQKINPASGAFISIGNSISLSFAERVEVILGPASVIYGSEAFAGVINIISKRDQSSDYFSSKLLYGSMNTRIVNLNLNYNLSKDINFFSNVYINYSDGLNLVGTDPSYDIVKQYSDPLTNKFEQPLNNYSVYSKISYKEDLNLSYFIQRFDEGNSYAQRASSVIFNKEGRWALTNHFVNASYKYSINEKSYLYSTLSYTSFHQDHNSVFFKWGVDGPLESTFKQFMTGRDQTWRLRSFYYNKHDKFEFMFGVEYENTNSIPHYANDQIFAAPVKFEGENAKIIEVEMTVSHYRSAGILQFTYTPFDWARLFIGGRYDILSLGDDQFSPRLGLILDPLKNTNIKFLYGTAYQIPSLFYQYEQWGSLTGVMLSEKEVQQTDPSWQLRNQKITTTEFAINQKLTDNFQLELSYYNSRMDDLIKRRTYNTTVVNKYFDDSVSVWQRNENIGNVVINGATVNLKYLYNTNLNFNIVYSYTDALEYNDDEDDEHLLARVSPNKFYFYTNASRIFDLIDISLRYKFFPEINHVNSNVFPDGKQDGFHNLDLMISLSPTTSKAKIYGRFFNILDQDIEHGGLVNQTFYLPTVPQPGFNFQLGLGVEF